MYSKKKKLRKFDVIYDNTSRNAIPKRGYYSELVSDMTKDDPNKDICVKKRMKMILQVYIRSNLTNPTILPFSEV